MHTGRKVVFIGKEFSLIIVGCPWQWEGRNPLIFEKGRGSASGRNIVNNRNRLPREVVSPHLWRDLEQVDVALEYMG